MEFEQTTLRLAEGDPRCLETILAQLGPRVRALLRERFGRSLNEHDLDDAVSIALARLWAKRAQYDPKKSALGTWFYLLARNAAIDVLRDRAHVSLSRESFSGRETTPAREGITPSIDEFSHVRQLVEVLERSLGRSRAEVLALLVPMAADRGDTEPEENAERSAHVSGVGIDPIELEHEMSAGAGDLDWSPRGATEGVLETKRAVQCG